MDPSEFTIGWICALPIELAAARGMLDEKYDYDARELRKDARDSNEYWLGRIAGHKIVLTLLISAGTNKAGSAAIHMNYTFKKLRFTLMVGIGGGVPNISTGQDIRLGDVVVSMPKGVYSGVIQYDSGKFLQNQEFQRTGALQAPPKHLQIVVKNLEARHESEENWIAKHINQMLQRYPRNTREGTDYRRPSRGHDLLFRAEYIHIESGDKCADCDKGQLVARRDRSEDEPVIHYGNIASGGSVVRDALKRDQLGKTCGALCVEMEAAGLMDESQCLVIRGICDYSDSHKNDDWQRYAAAAAAAYAKELLGAVSPNLEDTLPTPKSSIEYFRPSLEAPLHPPAEFAWEAREGECILVDALLNWYRSHGPRNQEPDEIRQCDLRIFEIVNKEFIIPTRRIAVRSSEHEEKCVSYWMPLDNVHVKTEDRQVTISWSDCSHIVEESRNYHTTFTGQYMPEDRNRRVTLDFFDISVIPKVADVLLYSTLKNSHYEKTPISTGKSTRSTCEVYKYRTSAESSDLDKDQHPEFAILISSNAADSSRSSKLYFSRLCLDFQQDKVQRMLVLKSMYCLKYMSSLKKPSKKDFLTHLDPEGGPDRWDWTTEDLELSLEDYGDVTLANLMEVVTGWRLLFIEDAPSVVIKSGSVRKKTIKGALVMIWEREAETGKTLQLLVRTSSSGGPRDPAWLSASLTSPPVEVTVPKVKTIGMKVQAYMRGTKIAIQHMSVDKSHVSETTASAQNIEHQFDKEDHCNRFYDAYRSTGQFLR